MTNNPTTANDVRFMFVASYKLLGEVVIIPTQPTLVITPVARFIHQHPRTLSAMSFPISA
jgi:hypothetical protein